MSPADVYATLPLELRLLALGLRIPVALSVEAFFKGEGLQRSNLLQYDPYGRRLWEPQGGRHSNFDIATLSRMRAALEGFVLARKTETGRWPYRKDAQLLKFARELVQNEGLASSDNIILKQIISPVLRKLNPRQRGEK
jgi:hypothetical protein